MPRKSTARRAYPIAGRIPLPAHYFAELHADLPLDEYVLRFESNAHLVPTGLSNWAEPDDEADDNFEAAVDVLQLEAA